MSDLTKQELLAQVDKLPLDWDRYSIKWKCGYNHCRNRVAKIAAETIGDAWKSIDSAPKNCRVLLYYPATTTVPCMIVSGCWDDDGNKAYPKPFWAHDSLVRLGVREVRRYQPTHWQPISEPFEA